MVNSKRNDASINVKDEIIERDRSYKHKTDNLPQIPNQFKSLTIPDKRSFNDKIYLEVCFFLQIIKICVLQIDAIKIERRCST